MTRQISPLPGLYGWKGACGTKQYADEAAGIENVLHVFSGLKCFHVFDNGIDFSLAEDVGELMTFVAVAEIVGVINFPGIDLFLGAIGFANKAEKPHVIF